MIECPFFNLYKTGIEANGLTFYYTDCEIAVRDGGFPPVDTQCPCGGNPANCRYNLDEFLGSDHNESYT